MKRKNLFVRITLLLTLLLLVAAVFVSCGEAAETTAYETVELNVEKLGEGENTFAFIATFEDKSVKRYEISTDAGTVGEAVRSYR